MSFFEVHRCHPSFIYILTSCIENAVYFWVHLNWVYVWYFCFVLFFSYYFLKDSRFLCFLLKFTIRLFSHTQSCIKWNFELPILHCWQLIEFFNRCLEILLFSDKYWSFLAIIFTGLFCYGWLWSEQNYGEVLVAKTSVMAWNGHNYLV